jgi:hypothetical protein
MAADFIVSQLARFLDHAPTGDNWLSATAAM